MIKDNKLPFRLSLTLLIAFVCFQIQAQSSYNDYSAFDKTEVYREDFSDNSSDWELYTSGERMGKINSGYFDWVSMNDRAQMKWHSLQDMDWSRDWQLEIRMKFVTGKKNSSNDLIWDMSSGNTNKYHYGFTGEGKYVLSRKTDSEYKSIVNFTPSSIVNKSDFNRVTVRKVGNQCYYFFNATLISTQDYETITGNQIGFMVAPNSTLQVDYLDISYLKAKATTSSNSNRNPSPTTTSTGEKFVGVMTKYNSFNGQRWKTRAEFPKDEIKADWDEGYTISDLSYDKDEWTLVMSKGTGFTGQNWKTRVEFPKTEIKELWDGGRSITELSYGNGLWVLVMSKSSAYGRQRWATNAEFPKEKIKEFWDDGLYITELTYGKDRWAVVGTTTSKISGQKWFTRVEYPKSEIDEYWELGYSISELAYHEGLWVLLMSKYADGRRQRWFRTDDFPQDKIREYWDEGYYITDITYGGKPASISRPENSPNTPLIIGDKLVGTWYGGAESELEKGYLIFDLNKYTTMVTEGDTIGGYNYVESGMKFDLKYELNESTYPTGIDIVFNSSGTEYGRLKGIIRMVNDNEFELKMSMELNSPRPAGFTNETNSKVSNFKRVR